MEIYNKLFNLQNSFKSKKDSYNNFGKYAYRNAEAMLSTLKPLMAEQKVILLFNEELINDNTMKCTASLIDIETGEKIETSSICKIDSRLKGMSEAQSSGACISYLRKYTMGALFAVDDGKDADSVDNTQKNTVQDRINQSDKSSALIQARINQCKTNDELMSLYQEIGTPQNTDLFTKRKNQLKS